MTDRYKERPHQTVLRHLGNGYNILTERGWEALFGAAMREAAKLIDSPVGVFLAPADIRRAGPELLRTQGLRATVGAVLRQLAVRHDPPPARGRNPVNKASRDHAARYHFRYDPTLPDGVAPARRPVDDMDFALETPFFFDPQPRAQGPVAAVVHAFYTDTLGDHLARLRNIPIGVDLFISTDTEEKKTEIASLTDGWPKGKVEIRVLPNRGRDIAAKFVGFRDIYDGYDLFIQLHTKKSPHGGAPLMRWGGYLLDNLLGTEATARSILALFDDPKLGVVFPQHLFEIRGTLDWGYNYDHARNLMRRLGVEIDKNLPLEFPSGSMFWGRVAAIRPLLDLGLSYVDFPEESGQFDGTIAHALERIVLMAAESRGYEWLKTVRRDLYPTSRAVLPVNEPADIPRHRLQVFQPCLAQVDTEWPVYAQGVREVRPIATYPSRNPRPRLNLLVPTINPRQIFGGVATALKLFHDWADRLGPDWDRRIVATDADIDPAGYASLSDYVATPFAASLDRTERALVDVFQRECGRLDLRDGDMFVATAWWTATIRKGLERDRARHFGGARPFVYLIQDDEPNFYGWSTKYALAETTYRDAADAIVVINSEELYASMTSKYGLAHAFCAPYSIDARIAHKLAPRPRERLILIYGRPSVARNAFELICDGLKIWQQRDPIRASRWSILFLGESFEPALVYPVQNAAVGGKVGLDAYADYLNRAAVGVSLMISPHPSYPPLEMAEAGLETITNAFSGKDLRRRFPDISNLDRLDPEVLAIEIERVVARAEPTIGTPGRRRIAAAQPLPGPVAAPEVVAARIQAALDHRGPRK